MIAIFKEASKQYCLQTSGKQNQVTLVFMIALTKYEDMLQDALVTLIG